MSQKNKEKLAELAVHATLRTWLDESVIDQVNVHFADDYAGEPSIFVSVYLKSEKNRLPSDKSSELRIAMREALLEIDDDRFPYLTFSAADDDFALEDARKSA